MILSILIGCTIFLLIKKVYKIKIVLMICLLATINTSLMLTFALTFTAKTERVLTSETLTLDSENYYYKRNYATKLQNENWFLGYGKFCFSGKRVVIYIPYSITKLSVDINL